MEATRVGISRALGLAAAFASGGLLLALLWHRALDHWLGSAGTPWAADALESAVVAALVLYLVLRSREQALLRSERKHRLLFERNLAAVYRTTPDGRILDGNQALARMLGYATRQDLLAGSVWDTCPDRAQRAAFLETVRRQGSCVSYEHRLLRLDGSSIWVLDAATLLAEPGEAEVIEGTMIEVTQRKVREDALRDEKDLIARLLETSPVGIVRLDRSGTIAFANRQAEAVLGLSRSLRPGVLYDAPEWRITGFDGGPFPPHQLPFARVAATHEPVRDVRHAIEWRDGRRALFSVNAAPLFDAAGEFDGVLLAGEDITEREAAAERLRTSDARYRDLYENTPAMLHSIGSDWRLRSVSQRWLETLGYTREEVIGRPSTDFLTEASRRFAREVVLPAFMQTGVCQDVPYEFVRKDGRVLEMLLSAVAERDSQGGVLHSLAVVTNVTEQRRAERALRDAKEYAENLIASADVMIVGLDASGCIQVFNQAAERISGYAREEVLGRSWFDVLAPTDRYPEAWQEFQRLEVEGGTPREFDGPILTRSGEERHISWRNSVLRAEGGATQVVSFGRDVTERRRAQADQLHLQEAVRRAAEEWAATFDALQSGVLVLDDRARVVRLNRAARELFGRPFEQCLGRELSALGTGEPWSTAAGLLATAANEGVGSAQAEDRVGGNWWDVSVSRAGDTGRTILVVRNVSRLRELEASVQRAETLAAMGVLTAGVAHEVRNPLFAVMANVDALGAVLGENAEVADLLDAVRKQVGRLGDLMVGLLEYGKPAPPIVRPGELLDVLEAAISSQLPRAESVGVGLHLKPGGEGFPVRMDADRLLRAFENLLANAILHSPREGQVTLDVERYQDDGAPWVRCRVLDGGPGFQPQDLPRVFEPFFTRRRGGTGLGLPIAQKIVSDHGGRIRAANRFEGGAELVVELPCCEADEPGEARGVK